MKTTLKIRGIRQIAMQLFLILSISLQATAASNIDQNEKLTLSLTNVTLETVFENIESKTDYSLFYENDLVDLKQIVSIKGANLSVAQVLSTVLANQRVSYKIVNKQIVLSKKQFKKLENVLEKSQQLKTVTGTVSDANGETLPGVNITVKGAIKGAQTDFNGNYSINVEDSDVLVFSYIGFKTKEIAVAGQTKINIILEEDIAALNEVVVIGYGTVKKSDLTGSVVKITDEQYEKQPITRVEEILKGRSAGVTVAPSNGSAGSGSKIRVRGVNSISSSNDPLVVVDGIFGGDLRTINPSDIASMEVLKDASATAIYGSRGANGVILITTKKGKGKPKVNLEYFNSISVLPRTLDDRLSSADFARGVNLVQEGAFSDTEIASFEANPVDYEDEIFRAAYGKNFSASVSGGSDKTSYFISGNYLDNEGIVITNEYERFAARANINVKVTSKLDVGLNIYGSRENQTNDPDAFNRTRGSVVLRALTFDPTTPPIGDDGEFNLTPIRDDLNLTGTLNQNIIGVLNESNVERVADRLNANFDIKYKILNGLTYNMLLSGNTLNQNTETFLVDQVSRARFQSRTRREYQISNILNWNRVFDKHSLNVTGLYELQGNETSTHASLINNPIGETIFLSSFDSEGLESVSNNAERRTIESYMGRVNYDFNKSWYATAALRVDKTSVFNDNTGYFPSAALAYSFNNLAFVRDSDILSSAKLRVSWGQVGNQNIPAGATQSGFATRNNLFLIDGINRGSALGLETFENPDITWETTESWNFATDIGFVKNRFNFSFDYFIKNTDNLLLQFLVPLTGNNFSQFDNVAEVENKGFDLGIGAQIFNTKNFKWNSNIAFSFVKNKIKKLNSATGFIRNAQDETSLASGENITQLTLGNSIGDFVGLRYLGVDEEGEPTYALNEDQVEDVGVIGNGTPTTTWGWNNTFELNNWDFNIFVEGAHDFDVYNQAAGFLENPTGVPQYYRNTVFRASTPPDNITDIPKLGTPININSDRYVEDGSFVRISNVSVGYTFHKFFKGLDFLKVYASGQNVALFTNYSGYDPQISSRQRFRGSRDQPADRSSGVDFGAVPNPRVITLGVKVGF